MQPEKVFDVRLTQTQLEIAIQAVGSVNVSVANGSRLVLELHDHLAKVLEDGGGTTEIEPDPKTQTAKK